MVIFNWGDQLVSICNQVLISDNENSEVIPLPETTLEWKELFNQASLHGLLPIVIKYLESRNIDNDSLREIIVEWYGIAFWDRQNYQLQVSVMRDLVGMFALEGVDVMFFKGAALAQIYPDPECRVFSDIDFYLYGQWQKGEDIMKRHGVEIIPFSHHHMRASYHSILLENHYDFLDRVNHRVNLMLDDELKRLAAKEGRTIIARFLGEEIANAYVMTPTMNAVFLMRHMSTHFVAETISLRMLYDWALFLKHQARDVNWAIATQLYEKSGMAKFVSIVQGLLISHLAMEIRDCPVKPIKDETTERVWRSILDPPAANPHKENSWAYYLYETKVFMNNRWKHRIVYPDESFLLLFLRHTWSALKNWS